MNVGDKITELQERGFCVLRQHFPQPLIDACREAFWPLLLDYLKRYAATPNRGPHRHFMPMSFAPPCFRPEFFFDAGILDVIHGVLGDMVVADQWGCDIPVLGSQNQEPHADYRRPLFAESPDLLLPAYMLVVSFSLVRIASENGPIAIASGTHRMTREQAMHAVRTGAIEMQPVPMEIGDVLIRHPWTLHGGTPNLTATPRPLVTIRYVRKWYADDSRDVNPIPLDVWQAMTPEQQAIMRFPVKTAPS